MSINGLNVNTDRWSKTSSDSDASFFLAAGEVRLDLPRAIEVRDLLSDGVAFISGGRDRNGALFIAIPRRNSEEIDDTYISDLNRIFVYLATTRSLEEKAKGFSFLVDLRGASWGELKPILRVVQEYFPYKVNHAYVLKPDGFWEKQKASMSNAKFTFEIIFITKEGLTKYIDIEELTEDFGGNLKYAHDIWIKMRIAFEKFLFESMALSTKLDEIRRGLLQEDFATNVPGIREQLHHHQHVKKWIVKAPIEILDDESRKVIRVIKDSCGIQKEDELNDECRNAIHQVRSMMETLLAQRDTLKELWQSRKGRLEQCFQFNIFKQDAEKMLAWIQENRTGFLQNCDEIGTDTETTSELIEEQKDFEASCVEVQVNIDRILQIAQRLHDIKYYDAEVIDCLAQRLDNEWKKLYMAVERRGLLLSASFEFHGSSEQYINLSKEWMEELLEFDNRTFTSLTEAEELLASHEKLKEHMCDAYEVVSEEGRKLLGVLQRPHTNDGRGSKARSRASDYSEAASHVMDVVLEMHEQNRQLTILWEKQRVRLSQRYKLCQFELESIKVLEWIENEGKPCFYKNVWYGDTTSSTDQLLKEHEEFEKRFEESHIKGKNLIESAAQLAETKECDPQEITDKVGQFEVELNSFADNIRKRKEILKMATNFFSCTDKLSSWVEKLKEELKLDEQATLDNESIDAILEKHRHQCDTTLDALLNTVREGEQLSHELFQESSNLRFRTSWIEDNNEKSPETTRLAVDTFLKDLNSSRQQLESLWLGKKQKLDYWVQIKNFERDLNSLLKNFEDWIASWDKKPLATDKNKAQIMLQKFLTEQQEMEKSVKTTTSNGEQLVSVLKDCGLEVTVTDAKASKVDSLVYMNDILKTLGDRKEELLEARGQLHRKLQHAVQLRRLEFDSKRVAGWIRHGENILHASLEPGSSLVEAEALLREYEQFQIAIEKTRIGVMEVKEKTEGLLKDDPVDPEVIAACAEGVEKKWERLMKMADQRRAVVFSSYNFYKASEQIGKLLDKFSKDCKSDEDPCREYKDCEVSIKKEKIAKLIVQYEQEKLAVENGCKEVRESSEKFLALVLPQGDGKSTPVLDGNMGRLEILVNDLVEQSTNQEITVIKQLQLRKNVLEGCLEYARFEKNVNEALKWIKDHGSNVASELEPSKHESENADISAPSRTRHDEFKEVFEEIREKVKVLLQEASTLISKTYFHSEGVKTWALSIDRRYKDFACFMKKYRQSLEIKLGCPIPELEEESEWPSLTSLQAKANELSSVTRRDISNDSGIHEMTEEKRRSAKRIEFIMNELLQTDRAYCKDLKCCIENFLYPMLDSSDVPDPLSGKHEIIFGNIEEIYEFHSTIFLQHLEKYEARPEDVGNCFIEWADKFQMYVDYCANKPESNALLIEHGENFFEDLQSKRKVVLSLAAYLIKPVQRITKYQLLLKELLSSCDDTHGILQNGLDVMLSVPRQANDTMYLCMIEGFNEGALETLGKILLQDSFMITDPKNIRRKGKERHIFLFEQALLFSKERKDSYGKVRYMYKNKMKTSELGITEHLAEDPCKFAVWIGEPPFHEERRIIKADSLEVKNMWVKELRELIQQFQFGILRARTSFYPTSPRKREQKKSNSTSVSESNTSSVVNVDRNSADLDSTISSTTKTSTDGITDIYLSTVDFKAVGPNEISLEKGQTVEVLSRPPGSKSWRVRRIGDVTQEGLVPFSVLKKSEDTVKVKLRQSVETLHSHSSEESMTTSDSASSSNYSQNTAGLDPTSRRSRSKSVNMGTLKMRTWSRASGRKLMNMTAKSPIPMTPIRATTISGGGSKKLQALLGAPESDIDLLLRPSILGPDSRSATLGRAPKNTFNGQLTKKRASFGIEDAGFQDDDNLSDSGSDTNDNPPPGSTARDAEAVALKKRSFVLKEIIQTEQDYVADLEAIVQIYVASLSKESSPAELKGKEKQLFGNIQQIYEFHKNSFLKEIEKCENAPEKLASVFLKAEKKLEMYVMYCQLKPKSATILHDYLDTFFEGVKNKTNHRLGLGDYLVKPVQRIMKYQLLLKDFVKYTSRAGLETTELKKALAVMQDVPKRANDMMNVGMLEGFTGTLNSQGKLLLQESLFVANAKTRARPQERRVFLFEQLLVFSEPFERKRDLTVFIYRHGIKMNTLGLTEIFDEDPCKWAVWSKNPNGSSEIYVLIARSPSIKKQWVSATRDVLENQLSLARALEHPIEKAKKNSNGHGERSLSLTPKSSPVPPIEAKSLDKMRRQSEGANAGKISPSGQVLSKPMSSLKHVKLISLAAAKSLEDLTKAFPVQERFIVLENYQAQTSDEMTVYKNDVVFLVSRPKKTAHFLHVRNFCRERSGLVPATILKRMSEETTEGKRQKVGGEFDSRLRRAASFGHGDKPRNRPKRTKSLHSAATLKRKKEAMKKKDKGTNTPTSPSKMAIDRLQAHWTANLDSSDEEQGSDTSASESLQKILHRENRTLFEVAPEFKLLPRDVTVDAPTNVKLTCTLMASPTAEVTWTKNDTVEMIPGDKYNIVNKKHVCVLEILRTHPSDSGTYTVTATNSLGSASCCAKVTVRGLAKPGSPSRPCITAMTSTSVVLAWDPPDTIDRIPISAYTVEYKETSATTWQIAIGVVTNTTTIVDDLVPAKTYQFRVSANNDVGISYPSPPSDAITMDLEADIEDAVLSPTEWREKMEDHYNVYSELGRGRFAVVKKCVDKNTGKEYAAKLIKIQMLEKEEVENEVAILRTLNHPSLCKIYDTFESQKNLILILELLPGGRLFDHIVIMDNLTEKIAIGFVKQILQALQYLQECCVVHLDIKPENLLLSSGSTPRLKLADFGEAIQISSQSYVHELNGSAEFTAPEIIHGEAVSLATDMWSLGVIVYVLVSGVSPFYSDNHDRTSQNITEIRYRFPSEFFSDISSEAKDFIEELLIVDQEHRPDTKECLRFPWLRMVEPGFKPQASNKRISLSRLAAFNARRRYQNEMSTSNIGCYSSKNKSTSGL